MPTTINADTLIGGAVVTGDTSGVLQLQTGGTTAVSISTGQVVTFTNTPVISGGISIVTTTGTQTLTNKTIDFANNTLTGVASTSTSQTLTNKTLTSPRIGTAVLDVNGNEVFAVTATASAVNDFTLVNAAAGSAPQIQASGNDTNISINLVPKGTGSIQAGGVPVVTTTGTQTLTNKTIAFSSNTLTGTLPIANGGTNSTATPTAGAIAYGTGSAFAFTSAGTSGQVLTSSGSGAPTWAAPGGGNWVFVSSTAANNAASVTFSLASDTLYVVVGRNVYGGGSGNIPINAAFGNLSSSIYSYGGGYWDGVNSAWYANNQASIRMVEGRTGAGSGGLFGNTNFIWYVNPYTGGGTMFPAIWGTNQTVGSNASTAFGFSSGGYYTSTSTAGTSIVISMNSGNIFGNFFLYKLTV